jgi:hypothetical protein
VLSPLQVAQREPLLAPPLQALALWAAAPFGWGTRGPPAPLLGASLARLLAGGAVSAADAQAAVQQAAEDGARYIVALPAGGGAQVLVHREASGADLLQALVHAHVLAAAAATGARGRRGAKKGAAGRGPGGGSSVAQLVVPAPGGKFLGSEYPQLLARLGGRGWETDRVSLVAPHHTLTW